MSFTRAFCRLLIAGIFLHAGLSKIVSFESVVSWAHDTMDANGFALDRIGLDDVGLVPMLVGIVTYLEVAGATLLILGFENMATKMLLFMLLVVTPVMHYPYPGGKFKSAEVPSILRNAALIGALLLIRDTTFQRKQKSD